MKNIFNNLINFMIAITLLILAFMNFDLSERVNDLETRLSTLQDQTLTLSKDQARLSDAVATWLENWQMDMFKSSAYSPLDDRNGMNSWGDGTVMASGARTIDHIDTAIAVDPEVIPLGSRVWIQGIGWRTAEDTGSAITGRKIDIPMWTFDEAMQHGRRDVLVMWPRS